MTSSIEETSTPPLGRRARNRVARHDQLLAAANEIVAESGLDGLTMQGVADRVECAVGTIYTYFASKSALIAALQISAVHTLLATYHRAAETWDRELESEGPGDEAVEALVRVLAYGQLFVAGPELHPREFEFLQMLLSTPSQIMHPDDVRMVTPQALTMLAEALVLVEAAVAAGALAAPDPARRDDGLRRVVRWIGGLDGVLLVANTNVSALPEPDADAFSARHLGQLMTEDLLRSWGAPPLVLQSAVEQVDRMRRAGTLLPRIDQD